jgi:hypothetical protein
MLFGLAKLELNMDWMCVVLYALLISQEPFGWVWEIWTIYIFTKSFLLLNCIHRPHDDSSLSFYTNTIMENMKSEESS